jgi:hypothetical protein
MPRLLAIVLAGLTSLAAQSIAAAEPLVTSEAIYPETELREVTAEGICRFERQEGDETEAFPVSADRLVRWGHPRVIGSRFQILVLADGSRLAGYTQTLDDALVIFDCPALGVLRIPRDRVETLLFRVPSDADRVDALIRRAARETDTLVLANGDTLSTTAMAIRAPAGQAVFVEPELTVSIAGGEKLTMSLGQVDRLEFAAARGRRSPSGPRWWVGFRDGTTVLSRSLVLGDAAQELEPFSAALRPDTRWTIERPGHVCYLQPIEQGIAYLSDRRPQAVKRIEYLETQPAVAVDRQAFGGTLTVGNRRWTKGLGVQSTTLMLFPVQPGEKTLAAEVAIDDAAGLTGSVRFVVLVGDRVAYTSPIVRGGDEPIPVRVDVSGASRIALVVQFAEGGPVGDLANWLDARLMP